MGGGAQGEDGGGLVEDGDLQLGKAGGDVGEDDLVVHGGGRVDLGDGGPGQGLGGGGQGQPLGGEGDARGSLGAGELTEKATEPKLPQVASLGAPAQARTAKV